MSYKKLLLNLLRDLVYVEKEYKKLKKNVEDFCAGTDGFSSKELFGVARDIVNGKYTYNEFCQQVDKELAKIKIRKTLS